MTVAERHYTIVRLECASGVSGCALAQTRGAPVALIIERLLVEQLIRRDAADIAARWQDMYDTTIAVGRTGLVMRAISLVDVALWDARGRREGRPVSDLLANHGRRRRVPVMYVAGYPGDRGELGQVVDSAHQAAERGHTTIKVARTPSDPRVTCELLERMDAVLPRWTRFVVDANWGLPSVEDALAEIGSWPTDRLAWLEDPFPPEEAIMIAELRRRAPVPIAAGDDLTDRVHAQRLLDHRAVDVLRIDVAALGGITAAQRLVTSAAEANVLVSFHISPETSIHIAAAHEICLDVETFDRTGNALDPSHELVLGGPIFVGGAAELSREPGLGFRLTPSAVGADSQA